MSVPERGAVLRALSAVKDPKSGMGRGGGDGEGHARRVEVVEQLDHAVHQARARLQARLELRAPGVPQGLDLEGRPEMLDQDFPAAGALGADHADVDVHRHVVAVLGGGGEEGVAGHRLGVDQQAVHIEDHGPHGARQAHAANSSAL